MSAERRQKIILVLMTLVAAVVISTLVIASAGCGEKAGVSAEKYAQVEKGMTLDQVEGLLGTPARSHRTGPSQNPTIIWYYDKTSGEGLLKIAFENAKVSNISPYDTSVNPDE
ncbi:MAG: outer membrane protein assembly factor BamE [Thermoleophilia bacterium]